ncbi:CNH domain-containing protein [Mycena olivaceomarginata]|nr:CNH domain-containing protein [Mycena olivaceomarginata]
MNAAPWVGEGDSMGRVEIWRKRVPNIGNGLVFACEPNITEEFYVPLEVTSVNYLKTRLCIGRPKGFAVVDLELLEAQALLDHTDDSFTQTLKPGSQKLNELHPMTIYRINNEFLLCYDECAFYVNRTGRRARKEFLVCWDGTPTGFALCPPYILAFTSSCVEVWHIETGAQVQVIPGVNVQLLCEGTQPSNIAEKYTDGATLEGGSDGLG